MKKFRNWSRVETMLQRQSRALSKLPHLEMKTLMWFWYDQYLARVFFFDFVIEICSLSNAFITPNRFRHQIDNFCEWTWLGFFFSKVSDQWGEDRGGHAVTPLGFSRKGCFPNQFFLATKTASEIVPTWSYTSLGWEGGLDRWVDGKHPPLFLTEVVVLLLLKRSWWMTMANYEYEVWHG